MVTVQVDVRAADLLKGLRNGEKRMAYAVVNAINYTAREVQKAAHERVRAEFIVRRPQFLFGSPGRPGGVAGKISPFANVSAGRMFARVFVDGGGSKGGKVLLPGFESGAERKPATPGAKHVAVPLTGRPARPSIAAGVPPAFTIAGLKLREFRAGKAVRRRRRGGAAATGVHDTDGRLRLPSSESGVQWKGLQRTFLVPGLGIFQRIGPARGDIRLIYAFTRPFRLEPRLRFESTATEVANREFGPALLFEVDKTLAFHGLKK